MKFSLFSHMERVDNEQSQKELYQEFLSLCDVADKGGVSTIWTGEHHGPKAGKANSISVSGYKATNYLYPIVIKAVR